MSSNKNTEYSPISDSGSSHGAPSHVSGTVPVFFGPVPPPTTQRMTPGQGQQNTQGGPSGLRRLLLQDDEVPQPPPQPQQPASQEPTSSTAPKKPRQQLAVFMEALIPADCYIPGLPDFAQPHALHNRGNHNNADTIRRALENIERQRAINQMFRATPNPPPAPKEPSTPMEEDD